MVSGFNITSLINVLLGRNMQIEFYIISFFNKRFGLLNNLLDFFFYCCMLFASVMKL